MSFEKIITDLKKQSFKPVYWLEGDEEFFIDKVVDFAEHQILNESEASFNLAVFYGKDTAWQDVLNACQKYPMFSDRQVVIIKEAQAMKDIDKLESYIEKPLSSTILFVSYKSKKVDGRTKLAKTLKEKGVVLTTKKIYDNELPEWTNELVRSKGFSINNKALMLLVDHVGNDLSRMNNEIDKLALNIGKSKTITDDDIEKYIGVSKDFNVFELQNAVAHKNLYKAIRIIQYFEANPKAAPLQLVFPSIYNYFTKVQMIHSLPVRDERSVSQALGLKPFFVKDYLNTAQRYNQQEVEKIILLLNHYNLRSIGIDDSGTPDALLLKEMVVKMMSN